MCALPDDAPSERQLSAARHHFQQRLLLPRSPSSQSSAPPRRYSKSRNGCLTCKARRRKCDELKPSCSQCLRRNMSCGGYTKKIKFIEVNDSAAETARSTRREGTRGPNTQNAKEKLHRTRPSVSDQVSSCHIENAAGNSKVFSDPLNSQIPATSTPVRSSAAFESNSSSLMPSAASTDVPTAQLQNSTASDNSAIPSLSSSTPDLHKDIMSILFPNATSELLDDEFSEAYMHTLCGAESQSHVPNTPRGEVIDDDGLFLLTQDSPKSFTTADSVLSVNSSQNLSGHWSTSPSWDLPQQTETLFPLYQHPPLTSDCPEAIAVVFDRRICEVLCMKDSKAGNPWRVIIWPMAKEHAAVYHAVAAMTYFQWSNTLPQVRVRGMQHLQTSIEALQSTQESESSLTVSLTARLLLAFAESWYYPRSSCGVKHVQEAKRLLQASLQISTNHIAYSNSTVSKGFPLTFLTKTWIYMDILTRITCDTVEELDLAFVPKSAALPVNPQSIEEERVDPLMGFAEPLFPLMGHVADLVRLVKKQLRKPNALSIISRAVKLKHAIECWTPVSNRHHPDPDPTTALLTPSDSDIVQTAYAYKWAALLLLCQAVPELPSRLSHESIAQKILSVIATVSAESKASIFHIFPLMVAGCDITDRDDRDWVRDRWQRLLAGGNSSGISERCLELTSEVWRRRDSQKRMKLDSDRGVLEGEDLSGDTAGYSVNSKFHWLAVMKEWNWEVLLG